MVGELFIEHEREKKKKIFKNYGKRKAWPFSKISAVIFNLFGGVLRGFFLLFPALVNLKLRKIYS